LAVKGARHAPGRRKTKGTRNLRRRQSRAPQTRTRRSDVRSPGSRKAKGETPPRTPGRTAQSRRIQARRRSHPAVEQPRVTRLLFTSSGTLGEGRKGFIKRRDEAGPLRLQAQTPPSPSPSGERAG